MTRWRALAWLPALAVLAGCSALKLTYNRLDWVAAWQIGRFVDLEPAQKTLFDERFDEFWRWHRGTQLGLYVRDLRQLADDAAAPLMAAKVEDYLERAKAHAARALRELAPDTARILRTLDDEQVAEFLDTLAERRREEAAETAGLTGEQLMALAEEQMARSLKRWVGPLTREQKARIRDWSRERQYAGTVGQQYREAWAAAFSEALAHRREADFEQRLIRLFGESRVPYADEMARVQAHNRSLWIGLMADVSAMLTPKQRGHFRDELLGLAADLDELAARSRHAALPGIIG